MSALWDSSFVALSESDVLSQLSRMLDPNHAEEIRAGFAALQQKDPQVIRSAIRGLEKVVQHGAELHPGVIGRYLFTASGTVVPDLNMQLEIRLARQELITALHSTIDLEQSTRLVENYFQKILAWNQETGWNKTIKIGIWNLPLYDAGSDLVAVESRLKQVLGNGSPHTSYSQIEAFFDPISRRLAQRYDYDSVMLGCIEPFKIAIAQSP
jgi:hypothetical protein